MKASILKELEELLELRGARLESLKERAEDNAVRRIGKLMMYRGTLPEEGHLRGILRIYSIESEIDIE